MDRPVTLSEAGFVYTCSILAVDYESTMRDAAHLRRRGMAGSKADAVEMAFDFALAKGTKNSWERTGEVYLDKEEGKYRAFCVATKERIGVR